MAYRKQPIQDELELETMAEAELSRLKRQYRMMENDRTTYGEKARLQLRNQQNMIERLEFEKSELVLAIKTSKSESNAKKDEEMDEKLKCLLVKRSKYVKMINNEKQQIDELQEQIIKVSKEVVGLKMKIRTDAQSREITEKHHRMIAILENRLDVATKRFNVVVAENAQLRARIDSLLKERAQFNILWAKMIGQLNTGKMVISDIIEQATITFNQRDEELNKIYALRERGTRDLKTHTSEMCELQRTLDNELKLQEFLGIKGQYRETADLNARKEAELRTKQEEKENKIASYSEILNLIKQFTGENDIDNLSTYFLKQEEENFALFSYVNELNDELEGLQIRVAQLRDDIDEARALNARRGFQQAETLEKIAKELEEQEKKANDAEENLVKCNEVIEKLLEGIDALFHSIGCDNSSILNLLGDNTHVTMNNIMLYLGIIEKRITEMLNKVHWVDVNGKSDTIRLDEERKPKLNIPVLSEIAPTQPCSLCVEKEVLQSVSEGLEVPLTRQDIKEKLYTAQSINDNSQLLHNVSGCYLPAARKIMQKRYQ
ncbi:Similar to Ccdc63: Coiled-coil domain-containing protein 63 (Rattus norvegicus) [Cotesia congregata]|uniref:Similar to Ccdc63: Coiled-coil domain-containing protein 63 (Rattus norvegicus) n=1 Tax=Cotesia congregata TaxID=51543 RepID=A0A8J2MXP1_COTCN|nr:Similar to Ccdc63: Coiled-coil domain-containing protein 63 (Rattus norvegicus) [Cotesia congregata]